MHHHRQRARGRRWATIAVVATLSALAAPACGDSDGNGESAEEGITLEPALAKDCVEIGGTQQYTSKVTEGAEVALVILYADGRMRGKEPRKIIDEDERFDVSFKIPADAPPGNVRVRTIAAKGSHTANQVRTFRVPSPDQPC